MHADAVDLELSPDLTCLTNPSGDPDADGL